jgi:hypothetical protein
LWRLDAAEHPRSPLAHHHRLIHDPARFLNDCVPAPGCHNPLPHSSAIRAFLNMHATSIHCGVCHFQSDDRPRSLTWYDLESGHTRTPPSILAAYGMVTGADTESRWKSADHAAQTRLVDSLRRAAKDAGGASDLEQLADHFEAYGFKSPGFARLPEAPNTARHFPASETPSIATGSPPPTPLSASGSPAGLGQ